MDQEGKQEDSQGESEFIHVSGFVYVFFWILNSAGIKPALEIFSINLANKKQNVRLKSRRMKNFCMGK